MHSTLTNAGYSLVTLGTGNDGEEEENGRGDTKRMRKKKKRELHNYTEEGRRDKCKAGAGANRQHFCLFGDHCEAAAVCVWWGGVERGGVGWGWVGRSIACPPAHQPTQPLPRWPATHRTSHVTAGHATPRHATTVQCLHTLWRKYAQNVIEPNM